MTSEGRPDAAAHERDFDTVLRLHAPALWRLTAAYAVARADREDLYQETLIAVWQALRRYEGKAALTTYLYRIATNRGLSWRARHGRATADPETIEAIADPTPDPARAAEDQSDSECLAAAVQALPATLAQTVTLFLEGLSHREIAEVLGITENNVGVRMNRARAILARSLTEQR